MEDDLGGASPRRGADARRDAPWVDAPERKGDHLNLTELRRVLEAHAPGSLIPRDWLLDQLGPASRPVEWCGIREAALRTGLSPDKLRRRALVWGNQEDPEIRVRKRNPRKERSIWLFSVEDCNAHPVDPPTRPLVDHYVRKATANL